MSLLDILRAKKKFEFQTPHSHETTLERLRNWQKEERSIARRMALGNKVPQVTIESPRSVKVFRLATARRGMPKQLVSADLQLKPLAEDKTQIKGSVKLSDYFLGRIRNIFLVFIVLWVLILCGGSSIDWSSPNVILGAAGFIAMPFIFSSVPYAMVLYRRNSLLQAIMTRLQE